MVPRSKKVDCDHAHACSASAAYCAVELSHAFQEKSFSSDAMPNLFFTVQGEKCGSCRKASSKPPTAPLIAQGNLDPDSVAAGSGFVSRGRVPPLCPPQNPSRRVAQVWPFKRATGFGCPGLDSETWETTNPNGPPLIPRELPINVVFRHDEGAGPLSTSRMFSLHRVQLLSPARASWHGGGAEPLRAIPRENAKAV